MKAVMYHYVRPSGVTPPDYHHLSLSDFQRQLDYFEDNHGFVSRDRFISIVDGEARVPNDGVVLTFDDGLRDHIRYVLPELRTRGLWGLFFVPTGPYVTGSLLDVHRIHVLLGRFGGKEVLDVLLGLVSEEMVPDRKREDFRNYTYVRQENAPATTRVKRVLNYYVSYDHRTEVLDRLEERILDKKVDPGDYYMSIDELQELRESGMVVGSHSVSHRVFSKLAPEEQENEIRRSFDFLQEQLGGLHPKTFCYPYGGDHTYTDVTLEILEEYGCELAFDVNPRDITLEDIRNQHLALPRYDCNDFPYGEASGGTG